MAPHRHRLGTKAETLKNLKEAGYKVPQPFLFTVAQWNSGPDAVVDAVRSEFAPERSLAIRSSCHLEDTGESSLAGAFRSVLDVAPVPADIAGAIREVVASYGDSPRDDDQVLVQPMLSGIVMSGVIMTRVLEDGSPYYAINYDDESGRTDTVTGGGTISKTVFVFRHFRNSDFDSPRLRNLLRLVRHLETFFDNQSLDIEFAMTSDLEYHIFQVRPIAARSNWHPEVQDDVTDKIEFVGDFLQTCNRPRPGMYGSRTILGVMPDWNPAEIIGLTPRPLAASLYRNIVTQSVWREARRSMGYRELPSEELMILIGGRPYIDVRASFNSFLPDGVEAETGELLVDAWLDRLDRNPNLHDKVEFEIVPTVLDFSFHRKFEERYPDLLSPDALARYRTALGRLTRQAVSTESGSSLPRALGAIEELKSRQDARDARRAESATGLLSQTKDLLEECRSLGTQPFAVLARHAFIAESFLRSAIERGAWTRERYESFKSSVRTISSDFAQDHARTLSGKLDPKIFFAKYGHLRPGTYDILTPTYRENAEQILQGTQRPHAHLDATEFVLDPAEREAFASLLSEIGMESVSPEALLHYAKTAIASRENSKFVFTRSLSDAIETLAAWGACHHFGREDVSWLSIQDILNTSVIPVLVDPREHFLPLIEQGKRQCDAGKHLKLGFLIRSERDVYIVPLHRSTPNFVTKSRVSGRIVHLEAGSVASQELSGAIVCIENADPGYDWLFSRGIAGLVTKYGGTNSHMTIRCSEYGIPAAIGCGEALFSRIRDARHAELDADARILRASP
ncbi:MAG: pyruvate, phosphate dikinase [Fibrobacterota bacterium]|nr:pyruvate, phosphate dikinase [Fibrobacterota bacterium]QQS07069.1 MAG: pyruvate, phosphate dikinase [Fibrobacterota bacterium]